MSRGVLVGIVSVTLLLAVTLLATALSQGSGDGSNHDLVAAATAVACPAPTPGPGEPTPTPPPTPGPTEFDVGLYFTFFDNTGQTASDFHICFDRGIGGAQLDANAPGCPQPTLTHAERSNEVDIVWPSACVDTGESIRILIAAPGSALVQCSFWTLLGSPLNACPGDNQSSPTVTVPPTPTPTFKRGDADCSGSVDAIDALEVLRYVAGLTVDEEPFCPSLGTAGNVDCDSDADAVDALRILRYVAALNPNLPGGCPPIGS